MAGFNKCLPIGIAWLIHRALQWVWHRRPIHSILRQNLWRLMLLVYISFTRAFLWGSKSEATSEACALSFALLYSWSWWGFISLSLAHWHLMHVGYKSFAATVLARKNITVMCSGCFCAPATRKQGSVRMLGIADRVSSLVLLIAGSKVEELAVQTQISRVANPIFLATWRSISALSTIFGRCNWLFKGMVSIFQCHLGFLMFRICDRVLIDWVSVCSGRTLE